MPNGPLSVLLLLQVLVATSTLAWGVNTPAHLVIIKGTEYFDAPSRCALLTSADLLSEAACNILAPLQGTQSAGWLGVHNPLFLLFCLEDAP